MTFFPPGGNTVTSVRGRRAKVTFFPAPQRPFRHVAARGGEGNVTSWALDARFVTPARARGGASDETGVDVRTTRGWKRAERGAAWKRGMSRLRTTLAALAAAPIFAAGAAPATATALDLRVDANRDGVLTHADDTPAEDAATTAAGALLLANVDDDSGRCAQDLASRTKRRLRLADLTACTDASDDVVNGAEDERDLAPVQVLPDPAATADVALTVAGPGRVFARRDGGAWQPATALTAAELRAGTTLAVEGTDIARDPAAGTTVTITAVGGDSVQLHLAPLIVPDATRPIETFLAAAPERRATIRARAHKDHAATLRYGRQLLKDKAAGKPVPARMKPRLRSWSTWKRYADDTFRANVRFAEGQARFLTNLERTVGRDVEQRTWETPWVQDQFEPAYQSVPAPGGGAQTMRVALMAGSLIERGEIAPTNPHAVRVASILRNLRGPGSALVHHREAPGTPRTAMEQWTTTGTMEATPPVPGAPHGKLIVGSRTKAGVTPSLKALVAAQAAQPLITLYTGWLDIGHTDETVAFTKADTARGWAVLVADPAAALATLRRVEGSTPVLRGLRGLDGRSAEVTAREVLAGPVGRASRFAAEHIDAQLATLRRELGLTEADIVRIPVLYTWQAGKRYVKALTGNTVNGVAPGDRTFLAPDPHGPETSDGDLFRAATTDALRKVGVTPRFVDTWPLPHLGTGELHCMTNALRDLGDARWWSR